MENDAGEEGTRANLILTALKVLVAVVFIAGMTFALVVGYAHFDEGSETPQFEKVEGYEFRQVVVNNWENPGPNHDDYNRTEIERLVFEYTNEERASEGLEELEYTDEFVEVSRGHSADMANHGYLGHTDSQNRSLRERMIFEDRRSKKVCMSPEDKQKLEDLQEEGYRVELMEMSDPAAGENGGAMFYETKVRDDRRDEVISPENEEEIARALVNDWMTSPAHRENILDEHWNTLSVGVYVSEGKTVFATQLFCAFDLPDVSVG